MKKPRVMLNSVLALLNSCVVIVSGFLVQRLMMDTLGQANIGMSSVFSNLVSLLSLAELGLSSAIMFHLYAPLTRHDATSVSTLMRLYAKAYRWIALAVAVLGLCMIPFLPLFLKDSPFEWSYVVGVFLLFLLRTAGSYLLSYRRALVIANQQMYVASLADIVWQLLALGLGAFALLKWHSFPLYLLIVAVLSGLGNLAIYIIAGRLHPQYLSRSSGGDGSASDDDSAKREAAALRKSVLKDVKNVFVTRISGVILRSTDSVIISSFEGVMAAGLYDNYNKIISAFLTLVTAVVNAVQPTLGHRYALGEKKRLEETLRLYTFAFYLVGTAISVCCICLCTPFITQLWLGGEYSMAFPVVALMCVNLFLLTVRSPLWSLLTVSGLFSRDKNIAIAGAAANLVISLALVIPLGVLGVLIGTFVSQMLQVVLKTRLLYRIALEEHSGAYVRQMTEYFALFFAQAALCVWLCSLVSLDGALADFLLKGVLCVSCVFVVNAAFFGRSQRFRSTLALLRETRN